ncbi:MAG TPA: glycosyltransferase family 9 protein [Candidatus Binataceae bacterium]|nr:glycosyltransferase family 9 protein [Candidatus Binataceae bacterium]
MNLAANEPTRAAIAPRALVVQSGFIGDVVLAACLFAPLRQAGFEVFPLVKPAALPLLRHHPDVARVVVDDKRGAHRGWRGLLEVAAGLRRMGFALALAPHRSHRTSLLLWLAGISSRIGFASAPLSFLLTQRVEVAPSDHQIIRNLSLLAAAGIEPGPPRLSLRMSEAARAQAQSLIGDRARPLIGIAPGSAWPTKRWPAEGFAAVVAALAAAYPRAGFVVLGEQADREAAATIGAAAAQVVDLTGRTSLEVWAGLIERLDLLISNDSAPVHVAAAYGVPTVAIFLATHPSFGFGPLLQPYRIAQASLNCRPCTPHGGARCPLGHFNCAHHLTPIAVASAALELLGGPA